MTRRILAWLIGLTPSEFRRRHGQELLVIHDERRRRVRGPAGRLAFAARELSGAAWLVVRLHMGLGAPGGESMLGTFGQDLRFGARTLVRNPGFAAAAIVVLALGIGANTAIFSAVNAFFFRPLPFAEPDQLVVIYETNPEFGWVDATAAPANLLDWREQVDAFTDVTGFQDFSSEVTALRDGEAFLIPSTQVLGNFFETLGVRAAMGRTFTLDETWDEANDVVVIGHELWQDHFGGDPNVVGSRMELPGSSLEIVGVMPAGFAFPSSRTQLWVTPGWAADAREQAWFRRAHSVRAIARMQPDVTREEANAQLQVVVDRLQVDYPGTNSVMGAGMAPLRDFLIREVRAALLVLLGAVGLLLLLACTNVANLMLVHGNDRVREIALRQALGAGRGRVARQVFTEGTLLAGLGGLAGLGLGWLGVRAIGLMTPLGIAGATDLALDYRVVLFTAAAAGLSGIVFGAAPALRAMGHDVQSALRDGGRGASSGRGTLRTVSTLVTVEVALALLLVTGAGLMVRTFVLLRDVDPGFTTDGIVAIQINTPEARYATRDEVLSFQQRFAESLEARPEILRTGLIGQPPLAGTSWSSQFQAEGWPPDRVGFEILHRRANTAYFEALDIPLVRGRLFQATDGAESPLVVVINETFAREHFPGEDPIGQRIAYSRQATPESTWYEIVGIVGDQHQVSPALPARAEVFESSDQDWGRTVWFVVRGEGDAARLVPTVRAVLDELDPLIPIAEARTLRDVWSASIAREAFVLTLLGVFGIVALLLATVGVYGVTAQAARRRTQELGIRMALGASAPSVLRLMLRHGLVVVGSGLVIGLALSIVTTRALGSLLFGVEPTDPATLVSVVALLGGVAFLAIYVPARRATALDPVTSLRAD